MVRSCCTKKISRARPSKDRRCLVFLGCCTDGLILSHSGAVLRGRLLGNYEIGRLLGEGSFGLVYEASPVGRPDTRVALKQITKLGVRREEILQGSWDTPGSGSR